VTLVLITFVCFVFANICSTIMVQAESRNRSIIAGTFEAGYALFWIYAAKYSLSTSPKEIVALVIGNFLGAWIGTKWGEKWIKDHADIATLSRIEEVEAELLLAEQSLAELHHEAEVHHDPEGHDHEE
jgi:hypothetical protein